VAGAGGWGDPGLRDPALVLHDVVEEKITAGYARREYRVAVEDGAVDEDGTARLRGTTPA
jgi:N-methylhydantoinase B/oxoprolinase/acetone carboxylase alpha subunit